MFLYAIKIRILEHETISKDFYLVRYFWNIFNINSNIHNSLSLIWKIKLGIILEIEIQNYVIFGLLGKLKRKSKDPMSVLLAVFFISKAI